MTDYLRGVLLMFLGVLVLSPDTLLIYLVSADRWTLLFWRGSLIALTIFAGMITVYRLDTLKKLTGIGIGGVVVGILIATSTISFVAAVTITTAANALVIVAASPLFAAVLSRLLLRELVPTRTWVAACAGLLSIVILMWGSAGHGSMAGDLLALVTSLSMALNFIIVRVFRGVSMIPAAGIGGLLCAVVVLPLAGAVSISRGDVIPLLLMGTIVLPVPLVIMTIAPRLIPAPEVGLILLLETVLGPLWVWLVVGQKPALETAVGGSLLLITLMCHSLLAFRQARQGVNVDKVNIG